MAGNFSKRNLLLEQEGCSVWGGVGGQGWAGDQWCGDGMSGDSVTRSDGVRLDGGVGEALVW